MSKRRTTALVFRKMGAITLAAYVPGFFRIHLRYIRNYPIVWAGLFVAPFIAVKLALVTIFGWFNTESKSGVAFDILAIFVIALCFFAAERNRHFRRYYIYLAPAIIFFSLLYSTWRQQGFMTPGFIVLGILIWLLAMVVWKLAGTKGYQALTHGGSRRYAKSVKLLQQGNFEKGFKLLQKSAKSGHFKSLFLMGEIYENGRGVDTDLFRAAELYLRASKKGYRPASERFEAVYERLEPEDHARLEKTVLREWLEG